MSSKKTEAPAKKTRVRMQTRASDHKTLVMNDMVAMFTPWDVRLSFGIITEANADRLVVEESVAIHTSPQFLVRMVQTLQKNIAAYENQFGEIKMPNGFQAGEDIKESA